MQTVKTESAQATMLSVLEKSWWHAWGGTVMSLIVYAFLLYTLLFFEEVTLVWYWRILLLVLFALIPVTFSWLAFRNGRFLLGLSKRALYYRPKGEQALLVACGWDSIKTVDYYYDGENDFLRLGLVKQVGKECPAPANGHWDNSDDQLFLLIDAISKKKAHQMIEAVKEFWAK